MSTWNDFLNVTSWYQNNSLVAQWVEDPALSLLRLCLPLWQRFDPWHRNLCMPHAQPPHLHQKNPSIFEICVHFYSVSIIIKEEAQCLNRKLTLRNKWPHKYGLLTWTLDVVVAYSVLFEYMTLSMVIITDPSVSWDIIMFASKL